MTNTSDLAYPLSHPNLCDHEVSRQGEAQPCEKPAVALRYDPDGPPYPVCAHHAQVNADMVLLSTIATLVDQTSRQRDEALVTAGVQRARADKANRRLANFTVAIDDQLGAEVQRQKAIALREAADSLTPDVLRGAPIHPSIIVAALRSRADKLNRQEADQ